ncbi:MAG: hypothetical protein O7I42_02390 [Alphaproteobacteria bacterium]|nr:hypothetical protein [Alphaproteobacteria bacterium]
MANRIPYLMNLAGARGTRTAIFQLGAVFLAAALFIFMSAGPTMAESAGQAVKRVLQDKSIQSVLPGKGQAQAPRFGNRSRPASSPWRGFGAIGQILLWGLVIAAACMLIFFIAREYTGLRRRPGRGTEDDEAGEAARPSAAEPTPPVDLLAEADRLAARGAFAEAVHLILIHSLRRLEAGSTAVLGASLTAREIISRAGLQEQARRWFSYIVNASELVHFGGRAADASAYAKCRDAFEKLAGETARVGQPPPVEESA